MSHQIGGPAKSRRRPRVRLKPDTTTGSGWSLTLRRGPA